MTGVLPNVSMRRLETYQYQRPNGPLKAPKPASKLKSMGAFGTPLG